MSEQNGEIVRRFIARINDGDPDAALTEVAADATMDWSTSEAPDSGFYHGHEQWREWLTGRQDAMSDVRFDLDEVIDVPPDRVVVVSHLRARGRNSGIETVALGAAVWKLQGGLVTHLRMYQTRADAFEAVGLS
jgi:ketosteroid isomerase-like protein